MPRVTYEPLDPLAHRIQQMKRIVIFFLLPRYIYAAVCLLAGIHLLFMSNKLNVGEANEAWKVKKAAEEAKAKSGAKSASKAE